MYQTSVCPLRTVVGDPVPVAADSEEETAITIVGQSRSSHDLQVRYNFQQTGFADIPLSPYARFLPSLEFENGTIRPADGMVSQPTMRSLFPQTPVVGLRALATDETTEDASRKLSVTLRIKLVESRLVGGIAFHGYPFLPYRIGSAGENTANFGLPREWTLTCAAQVGGRSPASAFEFVDADTAVTRQEITSHSGFHFLRVEPTLTDTLLLHLSDYPKILTKIVFRSGGSAEPAFVERYGFIVPYLYVFEYKELTRYRPGVATGLLAATTSSAPGADGADGADGAPVGSYAALGVYDSAPDHRIAGGQIENGSARYATFTAASVFGKRRTFRIPTGPGAERVFRECFVSARVPNGGSVVLYVEQAEDYERCIAGLKGFLPFLPQPSQAADRGEPGEVLGGLTGSRIDLSELARRPREEQQRFLQDLLKLPRVNFCEAVGLRVYEIDPLEGVSPLSEPLGSKYTTLLVDQRIDEMPESFLTLRHEGARFKRASTARYFAVELTNLGDTPGQFVVAGLDFVQSAHVSVHPRPARTQKVLAVHFRIIGPGLADDYSVLGPNGFTFSIERAVAGERKSVLFRAYSLLDLVHAGTARLVTNSRRRGVEEEKVEVVGGVKENFEHRRGDSKTVGWRRTESGQGVLPEPGWVNQPELGAFESHSNAETRSHTELLSPSQSNSDWEVAAAIGNAMFMVRKASVFDLNQSIMDLKNRLEDQGISAFLNPTNPLIPFYSGNPLYDDVEPLWRGLVRESSDALPGDPRVYKDRLKVQGLTSVTATPFGVSGLTAGVLDLFDAFTSTDNVADIFAHVALGTGQPAIPVLLGLGMANSLSVGFSVQPFGLGLTFSAATSGGLLLPSYTFVNTFGSQGSINRQASRTGYAYSQVKSTGFDEVPESNSYVSSGESRRIVKRRAVPDTDDHRVTGGEVMWQRQLTDIITGSVPLDLVLPATGSKAHRRTSDESLVVRLTGGVGESVSVDVWFDVIEEVIRDDY